MNTNARTKVLIVDDHVVFRQGLAIQLNTEPDIVVVGEAGDASTGIDMVVTLEPDTVMMDIDLPGASAFSAVETIHSIRPGTRIIFLSAFSHDVYIERALRAKARGYVTKSEPFSTIRQAIRDVANGWVHFSAEIRARMINAPEGPRLAAAPTTRFAKLTSREVELLRHVASGKSLKQIAGLMNISPKTADNHKTRLMTKLNIHDRVELARFAFREGYATP